MYYLLLAILSSAFVSIFMRLSTGHVKNNMTMFMSNYAVCIVLAILFGLNGKGADGSESMVFPIALGVLSGAMYLGSFMLFQSNIKKNGIVLSATFMKLGVIVPTLMAILVFHEKPGVTTVVGIVLAIIAIVIINQGDEPGEKKKISNKAFYLVVLLVAGGFTDALANVYDKCAAPSLKDLYLICTFVAAFICSFVVKVIKKQKFTLPDIGWGALIGIPNYFSARFLLLSLSKVQATVAYPVYNIGTIVIVTLAGLCLFKESISKKKWVALGIIVVALVLLNI